jgi:hypothetical protein
MLSMRVPLETMAGTLYGVAPALGIGGGARACSARAEPASEARALRVPAIGYRRCSCAPQRDPKRHFSPRKLVADETFAPWVAASHQL